MRYDTSERYTVPTRDLTAYLARRVLEPTGLVRVAVTDFGALPTDGLPLPFEPESMFGLDGYSATDDDDRALLREVFAWLRSIPGDFVLVDEGWVSVLERKGDEYLTDNPYVAALL